MRAESTQLEPGDRLGSYELLLVLGQGAFATVWLARLTGKHGFEKLVAVKTIRPERTGDEDTYKMFVAEARIVARIEHPNVARVSELNEDRGVSYFVMEYVKGASLADLRAAAKERGEAIPLAVAVSILADACAGLHAAHELSRGDESLGIVHRDVCPQNILVSETGIAKVLDFGVAKARPFVREQSAVGLVTGKTRFMAPEQASGAVRIDRRADVWALGAVAYELLEGRPLHDGPNDVARLHELVHGGNVRPMSAKVPEPVARAVLGALQRDPDARYATTVLMREALLEALSSLGMRADAADVAQFLGRMMAGQRAARDAEVERATSEIEAREDDRTTARHTPKQSAAADLPPHDYAFAGPPARRARVRRSWIGAAVVLVLLVAFVVKRAPSAEPAVEGTRVEAASSPAPPETAPVAEAPPAEPPLSPSASASASAEVPVSAPPRRVRPSAALPSRAPAAATTARRPALSKRSEREDDQIQ